LRAEEEAEHRRTEHGLQQVARGSGKRDENLVASGIPEVVGVVGDRDGEREDRAADNREDEREQDRAERVEVLERVEREAPCLLCGRVPSFQATQPWATSWSTTENITRMTETTSVKSTL
jgi:hypothetical protein